jgi:hypothetical protein
MTITYPTHFIDGTPIPPDYFTTLKSYMDDANSAQEQYSLDELEEYARKLDLSGETKSNNSK